jgi:hypothetical protein
LVERLGRDGRPGAEVGAAGDARRCLLEDAQPGLLAEHEEGVHTSAGEFDGEVRKRVALHGCLAWLGDRVGRRCRSLLFIPMAVRKTMCADVYAWACMWSCGCEWRGKVVGLGMDMDR